MSQWDKLLDRVRKFSPDLRFEELKKILESYGYEMYAPRGGSSHYTFRKAGYPPITIPKHKPVKKVYIEMIREVVERGEAANANS
ncbi:MAG: type II toxin-antitoxin system HicA family toxin [Eubacteriales bacterium]|nr:type II toxin-antitoxin system HicA family toxin [Eubacteriales bacterium]